MAIGQEEIGRRIAEAREAAELTQQDLAERIGVRSAQSISRYERGVTEVPGKRLRRIADATGKPLSFFVRPLEGERPATPDQEPVEALAELLAEIRAARQEVAELRAEFEARVPPASERRAPRGSA